MNTLAPRARNRLAKERRILDSALKVFADQGYYGTSMDAIAALAGVSKPTLYQYYGSKEQLFSVIMQEQRDAMLGAFEEPDGLGMVPELWAFAWHYADTVLRPDFLSLARLTIADEAESASEAVQLARGKQYDLALLDSALADMDSMALLRQLRQGIGASGVRHLVATGETSWHGFAAAIFDEAFARVFGDVAGFQIARGVRKALAGVRDGAKAFARDTADYLSEEGRVIVPKAEVDVFLDDVDALRERADRLDARVKRLAAASRKPDA